MINAVVFDFGNVICRFDNNLFLERISDFTDKSVEQVRGLIYEESDLPSRHETGLMSGEDFYEEVVKLCGLKDISMEGFRAAFTDIFTPIKTTFELIRRLKPNYKLGLLSNTSQWDFEYGIKVIDVFDLFDSVSVSCEVGVMKPDERIFNDALGKLGLVAEECVYIDDLEEFVEAVRAMGFYGVQYVGYEYLVRSLGELKIKF
ncbi:MAG: HAD family hydrolase [Planctomycetota bacterium]|jgi:putative hydrolase of the HAD superfamily